MLGLSTTCSTKPFFSQDLVEPLLLKLCYPNISSFFGLVNSAGSQHAKVGVFVFFSFKNGPLETGPEGLSSIPCWALNFL